MRKIKVGLVSHDYFPIIGGQGTYVSELIKNFKKRDNIEIQVFSTTDKKDSIKITNKNNFYFSLKFNLFLKKIIKKNKLNLLHLQGGPGGIFLFFKPKIPVVYTVHHSYLHKYKKFKNLLYKILYFYEKKSYQKASKIIVPSEELLQSLTKDYGIDKKRIIYLPEGYNKDIFFKKESKKIKNSIIFVGRLNKIKGVSNLIYAIKDFSSKKEIKLYIIGEGEELKNLKKIVKDNNLKEKIIFLGKLSQKEINDWYNQCEVSILPSYFEGFGLSAMESIGAGTPTIVTKQCGVSKIIAKNKFGIIIKSNEIKEILKGIELFFSKKIKINPNYVRNKFSWENIFNKTIKEYENETKNE